METTEAFKLALYNETEAIELYIKLSTEYPDAKGTFEFLMSEELKHKQLIEKNLRIKHIKEQVCGKISL